MELEESPIELGEGLVELGDISTTNSFSPATSPKHHQGPSRVIVTAFIASSAAECPMRHEE